LKKTGIFQGGRNPLLWLGLYQADDEHNFTASVSKICMEVKKAKKITMIDNGHLIPFSYFP
jgi:hypothetical protein